MKAILGAGVAALVLAGCSSQPDTPASETAFLTHVGERGVDQGDVMSTSGKSLGDAVCSDIKGDRVAVDDLQDHGGRVGVGVHHRGCAHAAGRHHRRNTAGEQ